MSGRALPREERAARLEVLQDAVDIAAACDELERLGYPTDPEALRSWCLRNGVEPRAGLALGSRPRKRLEASGALVDRLREILGELPQKLTGARAAVALGEVRSALADYDNGTK